MKRTLIQILERILGEGRHDPAIFKAVFVAGSPGSGKSYVQNNAMRGFGLKPIDSDKPFEHLLTKGGHTMDFNKLDPVLRDKIRTHAKGIAGNIENHYIDGRLGLIVQGTGWRTEKIADAKQKLESYGYECMMVFVHTSKEVALRRNSERDRVLPNDLLEKKWRQAHENIPDFVRMFGDDRFMIFNNDKAGEPDMTKLFTKIRNFTEEPIRNPRALRWIKTKKPRGGSQNEI